MKPRYGPVFDAVLRDEKAAPTRPEVTRNAKGEVWRYDPTRKPGNRRKFLGWVNYMAGARPPEWPAPGWWAGAGTPPPSPHAAAPLRQETTMSENDDLPDFVTPIKTGGEPCDEIDWRLPDDIHRELTERLESFRRARAEAMAHAHEYVIWR